MTFLELIPLTAALVNLVLTLFVITRNLRSVLTRVYALWGLSITIWNIGTFFLFRVEDASSAYFWAWFLQIGVIFLPVSLFHLCALIGHVQMRGFLWFLYGVHFLFLLILSQGHFIAGVREVIYGQHLAFYSVAGKGFWPYLFVYAFSSTATMALLYRRQKQVPPLHRARLRLLMLANGILIVMGANDILPILGMDYYPLTKVQIFPFGSVAAIFYGIIVGYSVLQHQLLDVYVTFGKLVAHVVRFLFIFLLGLSLLLVITVFASHQFTPFSFFSSLAVLLVSAIVASILFPRLFGQGDESIERRILGDRFEYHDQIQGFVQSIPRYSSTHSLLGDLHDLLVRTVQVRGYEIILLDETTRAFSVFRSYPERPPTPVASLKMDSAIFSLFTKTRMDYLAFNLAYAAPGATALERQARDELKAWKAEFCFPFFANDAPFGLLLLGEKGSGDPYTPHDLFLLTALMKNLSLVINQIRLQNQILLAQEMELLGRMSRGMAHDLNNLLTPVSTLLQLIGDDGADREKIDELLPMSLRNIRAVQAYIKEALFFSQHQAPHLQQFRLDLLLHKAVELAEGQLKRQQVKAIVETPPEAVMVEMDEALILRLIGNVLSNAIDASPVGGEIRLELQRLAKTDPQRDWLRTRVSDVGEGISRKNLERIFTPYFTTKDRGDERRGFGLGLAICRKIVHLHGGNLTIESVEKKGTTVQVDLPSRPVVPMTAVRA